MQTNAPGRGKLKVTGIIYIIYGVLGLLGSLILLGGGGLLAASGNSAGAVLGVVAGTLGVINTISAVFYLILGIEGDALLLADGKYRPTARPKRKNGKHVRLLPAFWPELASAALAGKDVNSEVRAQLLHLARERGQAAEQ